LNRRCARIAARAVFSPPLPASARRGAVRWRHAFVLFAILATAGAACDTRSGSIDGLLLATTSSAYDTGLLEALAAAYRATGPRISIRPLVVGTGEALALGRRGDADLLLVHAPEDELRYMAQGHGSLRLSVFTNDFAVVGPAADPAAVGVARDATAAFRRIAARRARFVSRGDDSGTHRAELALWAAAGATPEWAGYQEAGLGMGETLRVADERRAYTLSDVATFRFLEEGLGLTLLFGAGGELPNPYSVIVVRGSGNERAATEFARWLSGPEAAAVIARHGVERFGSPLFRPVAPAR